MQISPKVAESTKKVAESTKLGSPDTLCKVVLEGFAYLCIQKSLKLYYYETERNNLYANQ
jgi:hypothetical protein